MSQIFEIIWACYFHKKPTFNYKSLCKKLISRVGSMIEWYSFVISWNFFFAFLSSLQLYPDFFFYLRWTHRIKIYIAKNMVNGTLNINRNILVNRTARNWKPQAAEILEKFAIGLWKVSLLLPIYKWYHTWGNSSA